MDLADSCEYLYSKKLVRTCQEVRLEDFVLVCFRVMRRHVEGELVQSVPGRGLGK